jgi:hypothetical protein
VGKSFPLRDLLILLSNFYIITNQIIMKTQQTTISEVKLVYRTKVKASDRLQVKCSKDAFDIFMENWDLDTIEHIEEFKLMLLTRSNKVLGIASISKGGINGSLEFLRLLHLLNFFRINFHRTPFILVYID